MRSEENEPPADFAQVLHDERAALRAHGKAAATPLTALCFSGGGIRSATFNLGLLQALARARLLNRFDYLSTVSGGGFIGSWLTSCIREAGGDIDAVQDTLRRRGQDEPAQVRHLRQYSNYLTPRLGLASADGLVAVATGLRNLVLNGLQIWPLIVALMLLPPAISSSLFACSWWRQPAVAMALLAGGLALLAWALHFPLRRMVFSAENGAHAASWQTGLSYHVTMSLALAALLLGWTSVLHAGHDGEWIVRAILDRHGLWIAGVLLATFVVSAGLAWLRRQAGSASRRGSPLLGAAFAALVAAVIESQLIYLLVTFEPLWNWIEGSGTLLAREAVWGWQWRGQGQSLSLLFYLVFAYPLVLVLQVLSNWVFTGCTSRRMSDGTREWLARSDGIQLGLAGGLLAWFALGFGGALLGDWLLGSIAIRSGHLGAWMVSLSGPALSLLGIWFAQSARSPGSSEPAEVGSDTGVKDKLIDLAGSLAMPLTAIFVLLLFAFLGYTLVNAVQAKASGHAAVAMLSVSHTLPAADAACAAGERAGERAGGGAGEGGAGGISCTTISLTVGNWLEKQAGWPLAVCLTLLLLAWLIGSTFNVNRYSLHGFYRERLARAYLGGARAAGERHADPYTGFDADDNYPLHEACGQRPIQVINAALNVGNVEDLAWQERRALSFIFTPHYSGFSCTRLATGKAEAYRPTRLCGGGVSMAGAVAISGAAANPNMGYHSSPAVSFLLTLFDVRLGAWLGNPMNDHTWRQRYAGGGAEFSGIFMLREATGHLHAFSPWINLSDGGHFDNLGVYEMLRRGCRLIVAGDASADVRGSFDDLGRALRLVRSDLGIDFEEVVANGLPPDPTTPPPVAERAHYRRWRLFRIVYPSDWPADAPLTLHGDGAPADHDEERHGYLLYLKTTLLGDEPPDVLYYASAAPEFPHESTGDQFFSESQFESYRKLGDLSLPVSDPRLSWFFEALTRHGSCRS